MFDFNTTNNSYKTLNIVKENKTFHSWVASLFVFATSYCIFQAATRFSGAAPHIVPRSQQSANLGLVNIIELHFVRDRFSIS